MNRQQSCPECRCVSCNFGNDVPSELKALHFQSHFEVFRVESVWSWAVPGVRLRTALAVWSPVILVTIGVLIPKYSDSGPPDVYEEEISSASGLVSPCVWNLLYHWT